MGGRKSKKAEGKHKKADDDFTFFGSCTFVSSSKLL
jgi:hypothetical protein